MTEQIATVNLKLWTPEVLAGYLGVPVSWIYKRTRKKNAPELIPHIKLGKYVRFDPTSQAFRCWLATHQAGSQPSTTGDAQIATGNLTPSLPVDRVRATEKTGRIN